MSGPHDLAAANALAPPALRDNILFLALRTLPAGAWVEFGAAATPWTPGPDFERAGWRAIRLGIDAATGQADPLAGVGDTPVQWMVVHDSALERLVSWRAGACRPMAVLAHSAALGLPGLPQPAWQDALVSNGYVFAADDDNHAYFVRHDQPALQSRLAQLATQRWRARLQASRRAHAQGLREAEQTRKAALKTQAAAGAAQAEARALQQQLAALYASTSWRSTKALRWLSRLARQPGPALRQLGALGARLPLKVLRRALGRVLGFPPLRRHLGPLVRRHPALLRRLQSLLRPGAAPTPARAPAETPIIHPSNIVGPQFKTLLLDELERGVPPASH